MASMVVAAKRGLCQPEPGALQPERGDVRVVKGASLGCCSSMTRTAMERSN